MSWNRKRVWAVLKAVAAVAIVAGVARHFALILAKPELDPYPFALRVEYLVPAGLLYLLAHTFWGSFWVRLLWSQGVVVGMAAGLRAYFVSQFGKYLPGKVWVIGLRVGMLRDVVGGRPLAVAVTGVYETLTSMAAGAMLGVILLPWLGVLPEIVSDNTLVLFAIAAMPLGLGLVNAVAARRVAKLRGPEGKPLPNPPVALLAQGLLHGVCGWCLLGLSLALTVRAVAPDPPGFTGPGYLADLGAVALSYVVGFVVLVAPGGIGPREYVLQVLLAPRFAGTYSPGVAAAQAAVIALVLRLTWTVAEVTLAGGLYLWRPSGTRDAASGVDQPG